MTSASVPSPSTTACFSSALLRAPRSSRSRAAFSKSSASEAAYISLSTRRTKALVWPPMKSQKSSTIARCSSARDVADAGCRALVDVAEQAGPPDLGRALEDAVAARAHREDPQQQVDGLPDRPGVAVGAEVAGALALGPAPDHHPRELVADGDREPRVGLVVAVLHVEARVELLDPGVLQLQRLDLGLHDRPLDARRGGHHRGGARVQVAEVLEVRRQPRAQALRLADVDDPALRVAEPVDPRLGRDRPGFGPVGRGRWHAPTLRAGGDSHARRPTGPKSRRVDSRLPLSRDLLFFHGLSRPLRLRVDDQRRRRPTFNRGVADLLRLRAGAEKSVAASITLDPTFALGHATLALLGHEMCAAVDVRARMRDALLARARAPPSASAATSTPSPPTCAATRGR